MSVDKKIFKKSQIDKKIDRINKLMDTIEKTNKKIDYITETLILCNGEVIDKKSFSIMSLPSTKEILNDL